MPRRLVITGKGSSSDVELDALIDSIRELRLGVSVRDEPDPASGLGPPVWFPTQYTWREHWCQAVAASSGHQCRLVRVKGSYFCATTSHDLGSRATPPDPTRRYGR